MKQITTYEHLERFGRERLSQNFFMRDFLHSEIAAWHQMRNVPDHPDVAVEVGRNLCEQLLEPLHTTFGRLHIRSGYRSPEVNKFGNINRLGCASNESNFAAHIWDYPDAQGGYGATACIVIPWLINHVAGGGSWKDMAWWIHDHLPYSSLYFFPKSCAFNINWHERPVRRIDSYAAPKGCLTKQGMDNHSGSHASEYSGFLYPGRELVALNKAGPQTASLSGSVPIPDEKGIGDKATEPSMRPQKKLFRVVYRAIHTKTKWRRVNSHQSLDSATQGKDGARGLFTRRVRIDYEKHGDPLFVLVWEPTAEFGVAFCPDPSRASGMREISVPVSKMEEFEGNGKADLGWLDDAFNPKPNTQQ